MSSLPLQLARSFHCRIILVWELPGELFSVPWIVGLITLKECNINIKLVIDDPVNHLFTCSISAQSNFAVGAVVNASFGSITELTFYITALLRGHQAANLCLQELVKSTLTGTLLGCTLFIPVSNLYATTYSILHQLNIFSHCFCGSSENQVLLKLPG